MWTKHAVKAALTAGVMGLRVIQVLVVWGLLKHARQNISQYRNRKLKASA